MANDHFAIAIYVATGLNSLIGIVLIVIGFYLRFGRGFAEWISDAMNQDDFLQLQKFDIVFGLFTATGLILALVGIACACGVKNKHKALLRMYAAITAFMILVQLYTGLRAFIYKDEIKQLVSDENLIEGGNLKLAEIAYNTSHPEDSVAQFWHNTQDTFECCGAKDWLDWNLKANLSETGCVLKNHRTGCTEKIKERLNDDLLYYGVAALVFLFIEIVASFLSGWYSTVVNREPVPPPPPDVPFVLAYSPKRRSYY